MRKVTAFWSNVRAHRRRVLAHSQNRLIALSTPRPALIRKASTNTTATQNVATPVKTAAIQLRPYQEESIQSVLDHLSEGKTRLGLSLATGSGKTVIFSHLIEHVPCPTSLATQTLILAHRRELVEQASTHCRRLYPEKTVEIEMANQHATGLADITVASVQSITSGDRIQNFDPLRFKLVLVDEAHHIVSSTYMQVLQHFGLLDRTRLSHVALVGVSATFSRHDGIGLGAAIDHIVYHKDYLDMIEDQWLSNAIFTTVKTGVDLRNVKVSKGDFQASSLSQALNTAETNALTVRAWLEKASSRQSTIVFCIDINHVVNLTNTFREFGIDAQYITSATHRASRSEILDDFKAGKFPVLLNCGIFTEGTDIPNIDCVLIARPTQSRNLLVQMIGRGLRLFTGKDNCHIIDMVSSLETGIVTTPTLFGLDPSVLLEQNTTDQIETLKQKPPDDGALTAQAPEPEKITRTTLRGEIAFTDYDDINDLIQDTSGERHIRTMSPHSWVQIDDAKLILSTRNGDYLTIKRMTPEQLSKEPSATSTAPQTFVVTYTRKLPISATVKTPFAKPVEIAQSATYEGAIHAADTYATSSSAFPYEFVSKSARWRYAPCSSGQLEFLNKFRSEEEKLELGCGLNKGRAADWITKIKHGARGRFNRMAADKRREQKKTEKKTRWEENQRRARVTVGPVED